MIIMIALVHLHKSLLSSDHNENDADVHFVCEILISFHISAAKWILWYLIVENFPKNFQDISAFM
jgi:hypothetical protein